MRNILVVLMSMLSFTGLGQTWQQVDCNQLPVNIGCNWGGYVADINPIFDPQLFATNESDSTSSWVYGETEKPFLNSLTPIEGWITDSIEPYGINQRSELVIMMPHLEWSFVTWIYFEHRYDTDTLIDGGYVQFSCDSMNWNSFDIDNNWNGAPAFVEVSNYANSTIHDSVLAFNGSTADWIASSLAIMWVAPAFHGEENRDYVGCSENNLDTVYFRFVFESDSIETNRGGWMIRNIKIGTHDLPGSISETNYQPLTIYPNPARDLIQIELPKSAGNATETRFYDMMGKLAYSGTFRARQDVSFLKTGNYFVIVESDDGMFRSVLSKD